MLADRHPDDRGAVQHADDRGAAMVELAIVLPVLILLIFGIYNFGRGYNAKVELTGAVREGARAAALGQNAQAAVIAAAPGLTAGSITVTVVSACATPPVANSNAIVQATYPVAYNIPLFGTGTWTISVRGVMRCGV